MLKAVSSISNAIGALNYKGTWNANTNTPTLASGAGTKGDYYVVSVAGTTTLDGISNWGIGDWAVFNGSVWQRVEGGADLNGVNLSVSGTSTLASDATITNGNLIIGASSKGVDFSANANAPGMTSELLDWYEEGTWTPTVVGSVTAGTQTYAWQYGKYTRIGNQVTLVFSVRVATTLGATGNIRIGGLPFTGVSGQINAGGAAISDWGNLVANSYVFMSGVVPQNTNYLELTGATAATTSTGSVSTSSLTAGGYFDGTITYFV